MALNNLSRVNFRDPRFQEAMLRQARSSPKAVRTTRDITTAFTDEQVRRNLMKNQLGLQSQMQKARLDMAGQRLAMERDRVNFAHKMARDRLRESKRSLGIQTLMGLGTSLYGAYEGRRRRTAREAEAATANARWNALMKKYGYM